MSMSKKAFLSVMSCFATVVAICCAAGTVRSAELVMFESDTCSWCKRWHTEIGPAYPNTTEGQCAPLRRVDIGDPRPEDLEDVGAIVFTPTFVVVDGGTEVARLVGYPGEEFFWTLLAQKLVKLPQACPN